MKEQSTLMFKKLSELYLKYNLSISVIHDTKLFKDFLCSLNQYNYNKINEYHEPVYSYLNTLLNKYKYINGNQEDNLKNPDALFIFALYSNTNFYYSSPFYTNEDISRHNASAFERNNAFIKEIEFFLSKIDELETIKTENFFAL